MRDTQRWRRSSDGKTIEFTIDIQIQDVINIVAKKALGRKSLKATAMGGAIKIKGVVL